MSMAASSMMVSLAAGYVMAAAFFCFRTSSFRLRTVAFLSLSCAMLTCPLIVSARFPAIRFLVAVTLAFFLASMWDTHLDSSRTTRFTFREFLVFLANHCWLVAKATDTDAHRLPFIRRLQNFTVSSLVFLAFCLALYLTFSVDWTKYSFLTEHSAKAAVVPIWMVSAFNAYAAAFRLAGVRAFRFAENFCLAASPAEFWRRWNRPTQRWLYELVFRPLGGLRNPFPVTLATFAVSGFLHEYAVAIALGRITGHMTAFFLIHGIATAVTYRFKPTGWMVVPAVALTFAFNILSSFLFFLPAHEGIGFYVNDIPHLTPLW